MNDAPNSLNADALPEDAPYLAATTRWLERAVIGLNLCPFARAPHVQGKLRLRVSHARDTDALLDDLCGELQSLNALTPNECETGLLIHPFVLNDFLDYNDFLDVADAAVQTLGLEGEWQVASFHPDYQFADSAPDAIENFSNRSPYPTLHLAARIEHRAGDGVDERHRQHLSAQYRDIAATWYRWLEQLVARRRGLTHRDCVRSIQVRADRCCHAGE